MANKARVVYQFTAQATLESVITITGTDGSLAEQCKSVRSATGQFTQGATAQQSEQNFFNAFNADTINFTSSYEQNVQPDNWLATIVYKAGFIVQDGANSYLATADITGGDKPSLNPTYWLDLGVSTQVNQVVIESLSDSADITSYTSPTYASVSYLQNVEAPPTFSIDNVTAEAATGANDRNVYARFNCIVSNEPAPPYEFLSPVNKTPINSTADLWFNFLRTGGDRFININVINEPTGTSGQTPTVDYFTIDSVTVVNQDPPLNATATVNLDITFGDIATTREYSLNNQDWQNSPTFNGLLPSSYTIYVRDNLGALLSENFTIQNIAVGKPEPYFNIAKANPFRFVPLQNNGIPNWDNALFKTLLATVFKNVEYRCYSQLVANGDNVSTQIATSYDNLLVELFNADTDTLISSIPVSKKTNYVNLFDMRDCSLTSDQEDGKMLVYFGGGSTYDPDTGLSNGTYTNPTKQLTLEASLGNYFTISGTTNNNGTFTPLTQFFDEVSGFWCMKLDATYTAGDTQGVCKTNYDLKEWDYWEFDITSLDITGDNDYNLKITATDTDPRYDTVQWISEPIKRVEDIYSTVLFSYSNGSNVADIDFSTGIKFNLRLLGSFIESAVTNENENFTSDEGKKVNQKTITTETTTFESMPVPFYVTRKLFILSGMKDLQINGVEYVQGEDQSIDSLKGQKNPYQLLNMQYQLNDTVTISEEFGLSINGQSVLGTTTEDAIGITGLI